MGRVGVLGDRGSVWGACKVLDGGHVLKTLNGSTHFEWFKQLFFFFNYEMLLYCLHHVLMYFTTVQNLKMKVSEFTRET